MSLHTGSYYHDPVAREPESLDDLPVLPYAAADFTDTTPAASRYSLRDCSRRKQPLRLMFTTRDEEQFGMNCPEGGSDVTEYILILYHITIMHNALFVRMRGIINSLLPRPSLVSGL